MSTASTYDAAAEEDQESAGNVRIINDEQICSDLSDLRSARIWGTGLAWMLGTMVYEGWLLAGVGIIGLIFGKGPLTLIGSIPMIAFAYFVTRYHWFARCRIAVTRFMFSSTTPRCSSCDAALIDEISYQCSCCEHTHHSDLVAHWSRECPTCSIRPEAVVCWRCKSIVKIRDVEDIRAVSVLFQPTGAQS